MCQLKASTVTLGLINHGLLRFHRCLLFPGWPILLLARVCSSKCVEKHKKKLPSSASIESHTKKIFNRRTQQQSRRLHFYAATGPSCDTKTHVRNEIQGCFWGPLLYSTLCTVPLRMYTRRRIHSLASLNEAIATHNIDQFCTMYIIYNYNYGAYCHTHTPNNITVTCTQQVLLEYWLGLGTTGRSQ